MNLFMIVGIVAAVFAGFAAGYMYRKYLARARQKLAEKDVEKILSDARTQTETRRKEMEIELKKKME